MKKQNVRTISLIVCTFTYLLVGAAVFDALESETEKKRWEALLAIEFMIMKKYNITDEDFKLMETVVLKSEPHKAGQQWKFNGAFYYATTVLTTIGYGHSTPSTVGGKLFTMCYAIVGIPLGLVMFQSIGERVNRLSSFVIQTVKLSLHCRTTSASELDLICVVTTLSSLTIAGGAAAFSRFEGWSYFDSVYYCFITLTTIGFGDMVALQKDNALNRKPEYVIFALIFILFGLAIVAASLNLLVLRFVTMNTEDERRDEAQAMQALQVAVRLEGDVITANGSILSGRVGHNLEGSQQSIDGDNTSICSCHCGCFRASHHRRHRFKVRRSPSHHIHHLLPPAFPLSEFPTLTHRSRANTYNNNNNNNNSNNINNNNNNNNNNSISNRRNNTNTNNNNNNNNNEENMLLRYGDQQHHHQHHHQTINDDILLSHNNCGDRPPILFNSNGNSGGNAIHYCSDDDELIHHQHDQQHIDIMDMDYIEMNNYPFSTNDNYHNHNHRRRVTAPNDFDFERRGTQTKTHTKKNAVVTPSLPSVQISGGGLANNAIVAAAAAASSTSTAAAAAAATTTTTTTTIVTINHAPHDLPPDYQPQYRASI